MGSSIAYWYIKNQVIFIDNVGDVTADDFRSVDTQVIQLLMEAAEDGDFDVKVVVDNEKMTSLPSILELEGGRILKYFSQPNCGLTLVVINRSNPFLVVLSRLLTTVMGKKLLLADSLDDVMKQLKYLNIDLDNIPHISIWKTENLPEI